MRISTIKPRGHLARAGVVAAVTAVTIASTATGAYAAAVAMTLSATSGPSGGGNTITAVTPATATADGDFNASTVVNFQFLGAQTATAPSCSLTYLAPQALAATNATPPVPTAGVITVAPPAVKLLGTNKIAFTVPSSLALLAGQTTAKFSVCAYNGTTVAANGVAGSPLVAFALYTIAAKPIIGTVSPTTGPAQGGTLITVTGSNFPTTAGSITATLGGMPMVVTPGTTSQFTAVTPARAAGGPYPLVITTAGGSVTKQQVFTYTNGIVISPTNAPNTKVTGVDLDILGVGFSELTFDVTDGSAPDSDDAHVYLVRDKYNPDSSGGNKTVGEIDECNNVLVVTDKEIICTLTLNSRIADDGTYPTVASRSSITNATSNSTTLTTATAQFTQNDVGMLISAAGSEIPNGTRITAVNSPTNITLSAAATGLLPGVAVTVAPRPVASVTTSTTTNPNVLVSTAGFHQHDVGKTVTGAGISPGTTIIAVSQNGNNATISSPATADATVTVTVRTPVEVPEGTYTVTVVSNGAQEVQPGGSSADENYRQTIISSGSTFTVSDY